MFPLPFPAKGEGKYIEIQEEIPSPSTGEGQGGGENGIFSHLRGRRDGGDVFEKIFATFRIIWLPETAAMERVPPARQTIRRIHILETGSLPIFS
jgi:hypothetical protein